MCTILAVIIQFLITTEKKRTIKFLFYVTFCCFPTSSIIITGGSRGVVIVEGVRWMSDGFLGHESSYVTLALSAPRSRRS